MKKKIILLLLTVWSRAIFPIDHKHQWVPITGFAQAFVGNQKLQAATVHVVGTPWYVKTDQTGRFCFYACQGQFITLEIFKDSPLWWKNYQATQIGSFLVPREGFTGKYNELTFQVPRKITYSLFKNIVTKKENITLLPHTCQVAVTITAKGKTLVDDPQGEPKAKIVISQNNKLLTGINTIYFGILFDKTNPFDLNHTWSSLDGGALLVNVPASKILYKLSARKPGKHFDSVYFLCRPGAFINLSPPHGINVK